MPVGRSAEATLERNISKNPHFPFQILCCDENGNSVFVHSKRLLQYYLSLGTFIGSILVLLLWLAAEADKEYIVFGVLVVLVSCCLAVEYRSVCTVVLDTGSFQYSVYKDRTLVTTQHIHNMYIRLHKIRTGFRQTKFFLTINGWGFESPITLSKLSSNSTKLRILAHKIAQHLNLNYFDLGNVSKLHIVRHHHPKPHHTEHPNTEQSTSLL